MDCVKDERGVALVMALALLFFVSLFLFTFVSWHSSLYGSYDSLGTIYEKAAITIMQSG
ncbi:hypothetical protein [Sporosarcina gallistercoris]|uniref:Uncharacterized protein n=1 Tax=Sporosarcina gallistercoris TaxID=2762245 RepID=A0ABR8PF56_9BACL|nr:hypothetical protein [Sporosarcina gallistercoris]MBD7906810.1 hypothetical protein [Sporosarcina gallistercoris]